MTPEQKRLADRIMKLLALANSTTFSAEAQSARAVAEELMRTHSITLGPGKPSQETIECRTYVPFAKGMRWEGMIATALAKLCSCQIFFNSKTLDYYALVGTIWHLDMLEYMLQEVNRQRIRAWLEYKGSNGPDKFGKFCYGFAKALDDKILTMMVNAGAVETHLAKLVVWYENNVIHRKAGTATLALGAASSAAGLAAGESASLHRGALGRAHLQIGKKT
jgi:hypothetical protein